MVVDVGGAGKEKVISLVHRVCTPPFIPHMAVSSDPPFTQSPQLQLSPDSQVPFLLLKKVVISWGDLQIFSEAE